LDAAGAGVCAIGSLDWGRTTGPGPMNSPFRFVSRRRDRAEVKTVFRSLIRPTGIVRPDLGPLRRDAAPQRPARHHGVSLACRVKQSLNSTAVEKLPRQLRRLLWPRRVRLWPGGFPVPQQFEYAVHQCGCFCSDQTKPVVTAQLGR